MLITPKLIKIGDQELPFNSSSLILTKKSISSDNSIISLPSSDKLQLTHNTIQLKDSNSSVDIPIRKPLSNDPINTSQKNNRKKISNYTPKYTHRN